MLAMKNSFQSGITKFSHIVLLVAYCNSEALNVGDRFCVSSNVNTSTVYCSRADPSASIKTSSGPHPEFISEYFFPRTPVLNVDCFHDDLLELMRKKEPVVIKNCTFFTNALKWDLDYLSKELTEEYSVSLFNSTKFLYYDTKEDYAVFREAGWKPPYEARYRTFEEFLEIASEFSNSANGSHAYFQTLLLSEDTNSSVKNDLNNFDYSWIIRLAFELGWSTNIINMLFVGMPNVFSQAHYDMMENLFIQVKGKKRFILFSPEQFSKLYPYPVSHPHDRHSEVDFDNPDFQKFPKFRHVHALEAIVGPGDLVYVPMNWWHHVESYKNNFTVSLNFWFENHPPDRIPSFVKESASSETPIPLTSAENLTFMRYIESIAYNVTKNITKVKEIFEDLLNGRFQV